MQTVTIFQAGDLLKERKQADFFEVAHGTCCAAHISLETSKATRGAELYQRFGGPQPDQAIGIAQPAQQRWNRARIGKVAHAHDGPQPHEPYRVDCQLVEHIVSYSGRDM